MPPRTRLTALIEGVLAANIFDWGAKACVDLYHNGTILEIYRRTPCTACALHIVSLMADSAGSARAQHEGEREREKIRMSLAAGAMRRYGPDQGGLLMAQAGCQYTTRLQSASGTVLCNHYSSAGVGRNADIDSNAAPVSASVASLS